MNRNPLSGIRVTRIKNTIFVPLPKDMRREIAGGCQCPYCTEHPGKVPMWDTLAIAAVGNSEMGDRTWTVHYPEIQEGA